MTYKFGQIPPSTGLTATQKAWLNLASILCLGIAATTIPQSISGQLPNWITYIPAVASAIPQLIQLFLSGRLDPELALLIPGLQTVLAQAKLQTPVLVTQTPTTPAPGSVIATQTVSSPAPAASPLSPGFVNPNAAAPDI
jgi:hypothetical protein